MTCNPDPDCYLRQFLDWWIGDDGYAIEERDGATRWMFRRDDNSLCWGDTMEEIMPAFQVERAELLARNPNARPISVRFIVADTDDNPALDDGYVGKLMELPAVERERYLGDLDRRGGNWNVRPSAGMLNLRAWCRFVDAVDPNEQIVKVARSWDFAGTEPSETNRDPDWTRCIKIARAKSGQFYLVDGDGCRKTPGRVRDMLRRHAVADGPAVTQAIWQDPAQAGKDQVESIMKEIPGVPIRARVESKTKHTGMAGTIASQAEHGNVSIVRGPWVDSFLAEADTFPDGRHDDWIAALCRGYLEVMGAIQTDGYRGSPRRESPRGGGRRRRGGGRANRGTLV
jgi:predicted phage terminase large subunit-like protein